MVQGSVSLSLVCGDSAARLITEHVLVFKWFLTSSSGKPVFTVPIRSLNASSSCSNPHGCSNQFQQNPNSDKNIGKE